MKDGVAWIPGPWPGRPGIAARPRGGEWLGDEIRAWHQGGIDVVLSLLTPDEMSELDLQDEATKARHAGLRFLGFPIPDRGVPESRLAFAELVHSLEKDLRAGRRVAVHCRQGIGRSALVAASLLVSTGEAPDAALRVIEQARGIPVPETPEQRGWIAQFAANLASVR